MRQESKSHAAHCPASRSTFTCWKGLPSVIACMVLVVTACAPSSAAIPTGAQVSANTPTVAPAGTPPRPNTTLPARGGTVVTGISADPPTLNMAISVAFQTADVGAKIFEGLVWLDPNYELRPALATSWTVSPDGTMYTFNLRHGVKWHDGQDFTSADVKFSYEEVLAKVHPRMGPTLRLLQAVVETPDPFTVVIRLTAPFAPFLMQQTVLDAPIIPQHVYGGSDINTNPANQRPIGTGPFKFAEWNRGASLKVVRNDSYWESGKPYLDAIIFQIIPEPASRSTGLETGEIDFVDALYLLKSDVDRLAVNDKLEAKRGQGVPNFLNLMMNTRSPALARKEARQALAFAIDRDALARQAGAGLARPSTGPFSDGFPWLLDDKVSFATKYPLDRERAKVLLATAGVAPNSTLRLVFAATDGTLASAAQIIRDNLRQVGLNIDLQPVEPSVLIQKVNADKEFDLTLASITSLGDPAIGFDRLYITTDSKAGATNASGYSNPKVDELLGKAATGRTQEDRAAYYRELEAILSDDLPSIALFDGVNVDVASKKLSGLYQSRYSRDRWGDVSLARP
jgi:peptide/nickel transport system substrate-binding protein